MPHYAIVDSNGSLVSEASSVDAAMLSQKGLTAHEVDGPQDGRPWDDAKKAWGPAPAKQTNRISRARTLYAAATTDTQRVEAIAVALGVKD